MNQYQPWRGSLGLLGLWIFVGCAGADDGGGQTGEAVDCAPGGATPCASSLGPSTGASGEQGAMPPAVAASDLPTPADSGPPADGTDPGSPDMGTAMNDPGTVTSPGTTTPTAPSDEMAAPDAQPTDAVPVDAMPADAMPADAMPVDAMPADTMPADTTPVDQVPADPAPADPASSDTPADGPAPDTPVAASDEVPDIEYCADVSDWDPMWSQWEDEVLVLVNERRAEGADCHSEGMFDPADPLTMDPLLRCVARGHSLDMYERGFFDHTNPDGDGPGERLAAAGYMGSTWGENIAQGYASPEEVVQGWMDSDGHCSNIMAPQFSLIGVGYYPGDAGNGMRFAQNAHYWTQNFGAPARNFGNGR